MRSSGLPSRRPQARRLSSPSPSSSGVPPSPAFVRRFETCFALVYRALRARWDEEAAQRLTAEVLREHLDLLAPRPGDGDGAQRLGEEEVARLLASVRARAEDEARRRRDVR